MSWRTYILSQALGTAGFNALCNAALAAFLWHGESTLSYDAIGVDLATTPIWIGLLTVLLGTPFIRKALADGRMLREAGIRPHAALYHLPRNVLLRDAVAAGLCGLFFALPLSLVLPLLGDGILTGAEAIGSKVIITLAFSLLIVPLVVYATTKDVRAI